MRHLIPGDGAVAAVNNTCADNAVVVVFICASAAHAAEVHGAIDARLVQQSFDFSAIAGVEASLPDPYAPGTPVLVDVHDEQAGCLTVMATVRRRVSKEALSVWLPGRDAVTVHQNDVTPTRAA
jgi:hypothetical protein